MYRLPDNVRGKMTEDKSSSGVGFSMVYMSKFAFC